MNTIKANRYIILILFFILTTAFVFANQPDSSTRRFGIFIGSNNGGRERVMLRYAVTDARSIANVFTEMGGIANNDSVILVEPSIRDINRRIDALHEQVLRARATNRRTEIVFYYSGHSDEEGLLLNREKYTYRELRDRINGIPSDMRIVILDSCASGAFTRLKGGEKTLPFLLDTSSTAEGYAFLTSSSANEASQESDRIAASYFTHSLVAGLRGAADSVGDGRVTLNELYRYAYTETLARTESSLFGAQHPSYDIQIIGTGDLVLTDVSQMSASFVFDESLTGRISIRNSRDHLIVELTKMARPLELGLEPGLYRITLQQGSDVLRAEVTLVEGRRVLVTRDNFTLASLEPTRRRGSERGSEWVLNDDELTDEKLSGINIYTFFFNVVYAPSAFPIIGFVNTAIGNYEGFNAGFVNTINGNFSGFQAGFVNTVNGDFEGYQAGFVNLNSGKTSGFQSGFLNICGDEVSGPQFGFVNIAVQGVKKGFQFGFVNYADSFEDGIPIGFISIVRKGGYQAIEYSFSEFFTFNTAIKLGVEKFYTSICFSYNYSDEFSWGNFATGFGIGSIQSIGKLFFINPELHNLALSEWGKTAVNHVSFIPYFGINIGKFSIAAGPSVTWVNTNSAEKANKILDRSPVNLNIDLSNAQMPTPLYSLYEHDFNEYNKLVIGARIAARVSVTRF